MAQASDLQALWGNVKTEALKRMEFNIPVADAFNSVQPIVIDEDVLIMGVRPGEMHHGNILSTPDRKLTIEKVLEEQIGQRLSFRFIEGATVKDWEYVKERQQQAAAHVEASFASRKQQTVSSATLEEFSQELHRRFSAVEGRGFAQIKARWLLEVIPLIVETEQRLRSNEEQFHRQFARVIDRVAVLLDIPPMVVALEIEKFKASRT